MRMLAPLLVECLGQLGDAIKSVDAFALATDALRPILQLPVQGGVATGSAEASNEAKGTPGVGLPNTASAPSADPVLRARAVEALGNIWPAADARPWRGAASAGAEEKQPGEAGSVATAARGLDTQRRTLAWLPGWIAERLGAGEVWNVRLALLECLKSVIDKCAGGLFADVAPALFDCAAPQLADPKYARVRAAALRCLLALLTGVQVASAGESSKLFAQDALAALVKACTKLVDDEAFEVSHLASQVLPAARRHTARLQAVQGDV